MSADTWYEQQRTRLERRKQEKNLQAQFIPGDQYDPDQALHDYSCTSQDGQTAVFFRDLERHLIAHILQADVVLGCVAWLTSEPILRALARIKRVSIIVQKEDFLRPDLASRPHWTRRLRQLYDRLPGGLGRFEVEGTVLEGMTTAGVNEMAPVRCVGNYNTAKEPAFPRSHHKFVLFCQRHFPEGAEEYGAVFGRVVPEAVWTGSFNFTKTAGMSFENALVLRDPDIVQAFYQEYAQVAALSEPLDWTATWVEPEWRIGS